MIHSKRKEDGTVERENLFRIDIAKDDMVIDREEFILRHESAPVKAKRKELEEKLSKSIMKRVFGIHGLMKLFFILSLMIDICCAAYLLFHYFETKVFSMLPLCFSVFFFVLSGVFGVLKKVFEKKKRRTTLLMRLTTSMAV